jgi:hypothetical protein
MVGLPRVITATARAPRATTPLATRRCTPSSAARANPERSARSPTRRDRAFAADSRNLRWGCLVADLHGPFEERNVSRNELTNHSALILILLRSSSTHSMSTHSMAPRFAGARYAKALRVARWSRCSGFLATTSLHANARDAHRDTSLFARIRSAMRRGAADRVLRSVDATISECRSWLWKPAFH